MVYFFYPETSNYTLEEIDLLFLPEGMQDLAHRNPVAEKEGSNSSKGDVTKEVEKAA